MNAAFPLGFTSLIMYENQCRHRIDCANAQADLGLHSLHVANGTVSPVAAGTFSWNTEKTYLKSMILKLCLFQEL